jgi:arylsulfatase A-like enzyme
LVLTDDHRWDALGAAGNPAIQTPVMDRLLHDGVHFRQATASVSQCHPVRASLLTGLPSFRHGVYSIETQASGVSEKFGDLAFRAVRTPTHKLIVWHDPARGDELYDLATDPRELRNLILDPAALVTARDLRARLLAWMERTEDPARSWPRKL